MRTLALIGLACGILAHTLEAQLTATFDAGVSAVRYDGFVTSGAASLTPSVRWEHPRGRAFVTARGTYLRFESGNRSLDGSATGSWFTPLAEHWRGEIGLIAGASDYANIAKFSHGAAEARIHVIDAVHGGWLGATVGRTSFGATPRPVTVVAAGGWLLRSGVTLFASLDRSFVGDTAYSDVISSARLSSGALSLEGTLGARMFSNGGGRGVYGGGSAHVILGRHSALVVSAGRYPTDAVSGSVAGRYVTITLRLGAVGIRPRTHTEPRSFPLPGLGTRGAPHGGGTGYDAPSPEATTRLEIWTVRRDSVRLVLHAPGASAVEISGDFTDWQPVALRRGTDIDAWEGAFRIPRGMHRINVRRNGGPWLAPAGTIRSVDDYDGEVGIFLLP